MLNSVQNECQLILLFESCSLHRVSSFYSHICTFFIPTNKSLTTIIWTEPHPSANTSTRLVPGYRGFQTPKNPPIQNQTIFSTSRVQKTPENPRFHSNFDLSSEKPPKTPDSKSNHLQHIASSKNPRKPPISFQI